MPLLDHENLDAYQRSIDFLALALQLLKQLPRGEAETRIQLKRAAMSIPLNIADGAGKPSGPDRARFHAIARGSAMECGALVDVCRVAGLIPEETASQGRILLARIAAMLTKMCRP